MILSPEYYYPCEVSELMRSIKWRMRACTSNLRECIVMISHWDKSSEKTEDWLQFRIDYVKKWNSALSEALKWKNGCNNSLKFFLTELFSTIEANDHKLKKWKEQQNVMENKVHFPVETYYLNMKKLKCEYTLRYLYWLPLQPTWIYMLSL